MGLLFCIPIMIGPLNQSVAVHETGQSARHGCIACYIYKYHDAIGFAASVL